jgi:hypothetical protein
MEKKESRTRFNQIFEELNPADRKSKLICSIG